LKDGHYTACCRPNDGDTWMNFNDNFVEEIDASQIVTNKAYLLFFRRTSAARTQHPSEHRQ
jgi:ubiquitin C-terminal hydrolase